MKRLILTVVFATTLSLLPGCAFMQKEAEMYGYTQAPRNARDVTGYAFAADGANVCARPYYPYSGCWGGSLLGPTHFPMPPLRHCGRGLPQDLRPATR